MKWKILPAQSKPWLILMKAGSHTLRGFVGRSLATVGAAQQVLTFCWGFDHFSSHMSFYRKDKKLHYI